MVLRSRVEVGDAGFVCDGGKETAADAARDGDADGGRGCVFWEGSCGAAREKVLAVILSRDLR
jgi:hypothetical protein